MGIVIGVGVSFDAHGRYDLPNFKINDVVIPSA